MAQEAAQPVPPHRQDLVHGWEQDDLPVAAVVLGPDLPDPPRVDRPSAVDAVEAGLPEDGHDLSERTDVAQGAAAAAAHDGLVARGLEVVDVLGLEHEAARVPHVQQDEVGAGAAHPGILGGTPSEGKIAGQRASSAVLSRDGSVTRAITCAGHDLVVQGMDWSQRERAGRTGNGPVPGAVALQERDSTWVIS